MISDPSAPQNSLNPNDKATDRDLALDEPQVNFKTIIGGNQGLSAGLSASLLSVVGVGASAFGKTNSNARYQIKANLARTQEFYPDPTFIKTTMNDSAAIQAFLAATKYRKDLYVITGLMTALGASIASDEGKGKEFTAEIVISGAGAGVPGEIGPKVSKMQDATVSTSFDATGSIVIAYQLSRISWIRRDRAFQTRPHQKGSLLADGAITTSIKEDFHAEGLGLDEEKIGAGEFDLDTVPVEMGSGSSFTFVVPAPEEDDGTVEL